MFPALKKNAAVSYQSPVKIKLLKGAGLLNLQAMAPLEVLKTKMATVVSYSGLSGNQSVNKPRPQKISGVSPKTPENTSNPRNYYRCRAKS